MSLAGILKEIRACKVCERSTHCPSLPHSARPVLRASSSARILIIGQAPGNRAHQSGLPFDDPSGVRLREWMGVSAEEFYDRKNIAFVPMGFCFPGYHSNGSDLPPRKECAPLWHDKLLLELPYIELVLLVGIYAQRWYLKPFKSLVLSQIVRQGPQILIDLKGSVGIPLPHPSWRNTRWMKLNPWFEKKILPELQHQVRQRVSKARI